ncbi:hypothetical protein [Streptomyces europaeiscabiei]|uniref:hypothetical protein n=1 Tax=Streptomyces europaeiscabiei TaxID=146819 RepID=UPI0029BA2034|nr:hypothetical protein [Streptomyces europaeiscabiei]MDX3863272.1 hypothetical protein [Streptomyces europaeiscabiei]MDX3872735.1 hypothetical protein [Streptomyces europaeiscabiei]
MSDVNAPPLPQHVRVMDMGTRWLRARRPEIALSVAARMSAVLREHELLVPDSLEWAWFVYGSGGTGLITRMLLQGPIDDEDVPPRVARSRPARVLATALPPTESRDLIARLARDL